MVHNDPFCADFFNPFVPKQIVRVKLADLKTYVRIHPWTGSYTEKDGEDDVTIIGKHKLVTGSMTNLAKRSTFVFQDFIFKAYGQNCATHLLIPYVLVLCEERTFVFRSPSTLDSTTFSSKYYEESYFLMSIALVSGTQNIKNLRIMQYIPQKGNVFYEKTVDFEAPTCLNLGIRKEYLKDLPTAQKNYNFRYLTIENRKAKLSKEPPPEAKSQFHGTLALIQWSSSKLTIFGSGLDYSVNPGTNLSLDSWNLNEVKGRGREFCKFPKNGIAYDSSELDCTNRTLSHEPVILAESTNERNFSSLPILIFLLVVIVLVLVIFFAIRRSKNDFEKMSEMTSESGKKVSSAKVNAQPSGITIKTLAAHTKTGLIDPSSVSAIRSKSKIVVKAKPSRQFKLNRGQGIHPGLLTDEYPDDKTPHKGSDVSSIGNSSSKISFKSNVLAPRRNWKKVRKSKASTASLLINHFLR